MRLTKRFGLFLISLLAIIPSALAIDWNDILNPVRGLQTAVQKYPDAVSILILFTLFTVIAYFAFGKTIFKDAEDKGKRLHAVLSVSIGILFTFGLMIFLKDVVRKNIFEIIGPFAGLIMLIAIILLVTGFLKKQSGDKPQPVFLAAGLIVLNFLLETIFGTTYSDFLGGMGDLVDILVTVAWGYVIVSVYFFVLEKFSGIKHPKEPEEGTVGGWFKKKGEEATAWRAEKAKKEKEGKQIAKELGRTLRKTFRLNKRVGQKVTSALGEVNNAQLTKRNVDLAKVEDYLAEARNLEGKDIDLDALATELTTELVTKATEFPDIKKELDTLSKLLQKELKEVKDTLEIAETETAALKAAPVVSVTSKALRPLMASLRACKDHAENIRTEILGMEAEMKGLERHL